MRNARERRRGVYGGKIWNTNAPLHDGRTRGSLQGILWREIARPWISTNHQAPIDQTILKLELRNSKLFGNCINGTWYLCAVYSSHYELRHQGSCSRLRR